jgi:AcrR family transcriptional regulator
LRDIARASDISPSSLYYREKERRVSRLSPQIKQDIIRTASERPIYGYGRVRAIFRNNRTRINRKAVRRVLRERNLFRPTEPNQLVKTDITYVLTQQGMTYLMCMKDSFTKEWQGYQYIPSHASPKMQSGEWKVLF